MNRFYASAEAAKGVAGFEVRLDGRPVRTPAKHMLALPTEALALAIAAEWAAQGETVKPETMPLTRLAHVAIDRTPGLRAEMIAEAARYLDTDLLCHRAEGPPALVARQAQAWGPLIDWAAARLGARLVVAPGVIAQAQPPGALSAFAAIADGMDDFALTGLAHGVALFGSAVVALALAEGRLGAEAAFAAAHLDEQWSVETWGADAELLARLENRRAESLALGVWFAALRTS